MRGPGDWSPGFPDETPEEREENNSKLKREEDYPNTRLAVAEAQAEEYGCTIEFADDRTLQIDIDTPAAHHTFYQQLQLLDDLGILTHGSFKVRTSKSGNQHITIKLLDPLPVEQRILLQARLGSDLKRELLSYARVRKGIDHPVLLFRPKEGTNGNGTDHKN